MIQTLPDSLILKILSFCDPVDVAHVGQLSTSLRDICHDNLLWRQLFHQFFQLPIFHHDTLLNYSWRSEFIRLVDEVPIIETQSFNKHTDQVLHVAFSNNGKVFVTTGKDCWIHVWKSDYPSSHSCSYDMSPFSWKYTQFSQFNESDTLLLCSGVQFGSFSTSGEIAIFALDGDELHLRCRTRNKPYDIFGSWYSDNYFFSGELKWLNQMTSKSEVWLNKASQESESEHKAIMNHLFTFYNPQTTSIRQILVAKSNTDFDKLSLQTPGGTQSQDPSVNTGIGLKSLKNRSGNPTSKIITLEKNYGGAGTSTCPGRNISDIHYSEEYHKNQRKASDPENLKTGTLETDSAADAPGTSKTSSRTVSPESDSTDDDELLETREKILIFTCGRDSFTPHMIGFKRIDPISFKSRVQFRPICEAIEERKRRDELLRELRRNPGSPVNRNIQNNESDLYDRPEVIINLRGHIVGMCLSPDDNRYLYVNCRSWPTDCVISDPLQPPPLAQEVDIHVIDLLTMKEVGKMSRATRAYTSSEECFFIFLNATEAYLASGSEDSAAYLWDRNYGISLTRLPHTDVVNCVSFNPQNNEMLVTVSDDNLIKVWRSKRLCRELGIDYKDLPAGTKLYLNKRN